MMKKKNQEHENMKDDSIDKSAENKENTAAATAEPAVEGADVENGESQVASDKTVADGRVMEEKLAEMQDRYIRLSAEFDNYRKRTLREKMDMTKYAGENILLGLIPVIDDFERAIAHIDSTTDFNALKNGIDLIYGKLIDFLKQNGVKEIDSLNGNFNVDLQEAVAKVPVEESDKKGKVIDVVQKGYFLQDKVLRFAKVVVGE
jgi:molecular chaperone GrpE